jgi:hypothetical protein
MQQMNPGNGTAAQVQAQQQLQMQHQLLSMMNGGMSGWGGMGNVPGMQGLGGQAAPTANQMQMLMQMQMMAASAGGLMNPGGYDAASLGVSYAPQGMMMVGVYSFVAFRS